MFEKASRLKLRFNYKGICTVEDLWDMPLSDLDSIFKSMNAHLKTQKEESLLKKRSEEDEVAALMVEIVKHVVGVRLAEQEARENATLKAARKQKLLGIIEEKQDGALRDMSVEDLEKLVGDL